MIVYDSCIRQADLAAARSSLAAARAALLSAAGKADRRKAAEAVEFWSGRAAMLSLLVGWSD